MPSFGANQSSFPQHGLTGDKTYIVLKCHSYLSNYSFAFLSFKWLTGETLFAVEAKL